MHRFLLFLVGLVVAIASPLKSYSVSDVTVSGLSSGGYMAVQVHVAYSSIVNGSAIFAGGPFYCAESNLMNAEYKCMKISMGLPDTGRLVDLTHKDEAAGLIDKVSNLKDDRVYLFSGKDDTVVNPKVMQELQTYYQAFVDVKNIVADYNIEAEHCIPTLNFGEACSRLSSPYIGKCNFDGAGIAFNTLYNTQSSTTAVTKNLLSFTQTSYLPSGSTLKSASLGETGYVYVPTACQSGTTSCHLHIAFHGCEQTEADIGTDFAVHGGYNEWAEANNIIVLYPFTVKSMSMPSNPNGCWDWWAYTGKDYGVNTGVQMQFVRNLIKGISGK